MRVIYSRHSDVVPEEFREVFEEAFVTLKLHCVQIVEDLVKRGELDVNLDEPSDYSDLMSFSDT
jgi:hypothetical protein